MTDELTEKYLKGSISKWEMDSLHYYYHDHELKHVATALHKIKDFSTLPEQPVILENKKSVLQQSATRSDLFILQF
jgi:DNA polymerase-3 subunit alpha